MRKFHMKADGSGPGICTASEKACPNGEFGHYSSKEEVWASFEIAMEDETIPAPPSLIKKHIIADVLDQRKMAEEWVSESKNESDKITAYEAFHPGDHQTYAKFITSDDPLKRSIAAKRLRNKQGIDNFIETEQNPNLLTDLSENLNLTEDQRDAVIEKLTTLRSSSEGYQFKKWHQMSLDKSSQTSFPNPPREARATAEAYVEANKNTKEFIKNFDSNLMKMRNKIRDEINTASSREEKIDLNKLLKTLSETPKLSRGTRMGGISSLSLNFENSPLKAKDKNRLHKELFSAFEGQHQDFFINDKGSLEVRFSSHEEARILTDSGVDVVRSKN